jgi:hypothetical protein
MNKTIMFASLSTLSIWACGKDDPRDACMSACDAAVEMDERCDFGITDCDSVCDEAEDAYNMEECSEEFTEYFDCTAGLAFDSMECDIDAVMAAIQEDCTSEAMSLLACAE